MRFQPRLMIPGPTAIPPQVQEAMMRPMIGHRSGDFSKLHERVVGKLAHLFGTHNEIVILTASGTGAMEAAVANTIRPGDPVLALVSGVFGQRFAELAQIYGAQVTTVTVPPGQAVEASDVARALSEREYRLVLATHNETSTGVTNPIQEIGPLVKAHGALFAVDAVSSMGSTPIATDEWGVDLMVTGSQKALMLPPGLAMVSVSPQAWKVIAEVQSPNYYLSLSAAKKSLAQWSTPYTPNVTLFVGLDAALDLLFEEGLDEVYRRHEISAQATRVGVREMGLELLARPGRASAAVTSIKAPAGLDVEAFRKYLKRKYAITVAGGQADLKGQIFRIGHLGTIDPLSVMATLAGVELSLAQMGMELSLGAGLKAAAGYLAQALKED